MLNGEAISQRCKVQSYAFASGETSRTECGSSPLIPYHMGTGWLVVFLQRYYKLYLSVSFNRLILNNL